MGEREQQSECACASERVWSCAATWAKNTRPSLCHGCQVAVHSLLRCCLPLACLLAGVVTFGKSRKSRKSSRDFGNRKGERERESVDWPTCLRTNTVWRGARRGNGVSLKRASLLPASPGTLATLAVPLRRRRRARPRVASLDGHVARDDGCSGYG